jgi:hypothetical protein
MQPIFKRDSAALASVCVKLASAMQSIVKRPLLANHAQ